MKIERSTVPLALLAGLLAWTVSCAPVLKEDNIYDPAGIGLVTSGYSGLSASGSLSISRADGLITPLDEGTSIDLNVTLSGWPSSAYLQARVSLSAEVAIFVNGVRFTRPTGAVRFNPPEFFFKYTGSDQTRTVSVTIDDQTISDQNYVITVSADGLTEGSVEIRNRDGDLLMEDMSAGQGVQSGQNPSLVYDSTNDRVLTLARNVNGGGANTNRLSLFRCDTNGKGCTYADLSPAGAGGDNTGISPKALIDAVNGRLLVLAQRNPVGGPLLLHNCDLTGASCVMSDLSTGANFLSGALDASGYIIHDAILDTVNNKLIISAHGAVIQNLHIFRCNLDGTGCTARDLGVAHNNSSLSYYNSSSSPPLLYIAAVAGGNIFAHRCSADASSCVNVNITQAVGRASGESSPSLAIDASSSPPRLLIAASSSTPILYVCSLDLNSRVYKNISAGEGANSGNTPRIGLDPVNDRLLVVARNSFQADRPGMFRCKLDGTQCTHTSLSPNDSNNGWTPSMWIDGPNNRIFIATADASRSDRPTFFRLPLVYREE